MEHEEGLGLDWNFAFYRTYDPSIGRWGQIDPRYNVAVSPYAGMGNNPILFSDPLGDTTRIYTMEGGLVGSINDSHPNQEHFYNNDGVQSAEFLMDLEASGRWSADDAGIVARDLSEYYVGENTRSDLADLSARGDKDGAEAYGILTYTSENRELRVHDKSDRFPVSNDPVDDGCNCRTAAGVGFTKAVARGLLGSTTGKVAFDAHSHGFYSELYEAGGDYGLAKQNFSLYHTGRPSGSDKLGSSLSEVAGFKASVVATPFGYTIYSTNRNIRSTYYDSSGNFKK